MEYWDVPEERRDADISLATDSCVIDDQFFFVHGCLEIPIRDAEEVLIFGVWVSLKEEDFLIWEDNYEAVQRSHIGPFSGSLSLLPLSEHDGAEGEFAFAGRRDPAFD